MQQQVIEPQYRPQSKTDWVLDTLAIAAGSAVVGITLSWPFSKLFTWALTDRLR